MPAREIHLLDDRLLLGREFPEVHAYIDRPVKWMGKKHRRIRHDLETVMLILAVTRDPLAAVSAIMHISRDRREKS